MIAPDGLACALVAGAVAALPSLFVYGRVRRLEDLSYRDYQTGLRSVRLLDDDLALLGRTEANSSARRTLSASLKAWA